MHCAPSTSGYSPSSSSSSKYTFKDPLWYVDDYDAEVCEAREAAMKYTYELYVLDEVMLRRQMELVTVHCARKVGKEEKEARNMECLLYRSYCEIRAEQMIGMDVRGRLDTFRAAIKACTHKGYLCPGVEGDLLYGADLMKDGAKAIRIDFLNRLEETQKHEHELGDIDLMPVEKIEMLVDEYLKVEELEIRLVQYQMKTNVNVSVDPPEGITPIQRQEWNCWRLFAQVIPVDEMGTFKLFLEFLEDAIETYTNWKPQKPRKETVILLRAGLARMGRCACQKWKYKHTLKLIRNYNRLIKTEQKTLEAIERRVERKSQAIRKEWEELLRDYPELLEYTSESDRNLVEQMYKDDIDLTKGMGEARKLDCMKRQKKYKRKMEILRKMRRLEVRSESRHLTSTQIGQYQTYQMDLWEVSDAESDSDSDSD
ncbi:unnamed protein product [Caenorhabditis sp. 36 PRJEB53466]|nr:unnamed protein product [Caenorhabditis sp. 36 PRJEB53466]